MFGKKESNNEKNEEQLASDLVQQEVATVEKIAPRTTAGGPPATPTETSLRVSDRAEPEEGLEDILEAIKRTAKLIENAKFVVALTGAGISVESGIPDFRSPGGLWTWYEPSVYASLESFIDDPTKFWEMAQDIIPMIERAQPNPAHLALAEMEKMGRCQLILSQNVDDLLEKAGCSKNIKLHGHFLTTTCLECGQRFRTSEVLNPVRGVGAPQCSSCHGHLKPDVILYSEPLNPRDLLRAKEAVSKCDLILIIGSSLEVYPVASLPETAMKSGADVVIFNLEPTPFDEEATVVCRGNASVTIPALLEECKILMGKEREGI